MKHSWRLPNSSWPLSSQLASFFCIFVFVITTFGGSVDGCFVNTGATNYGKTYPTGDIVLYVGKPLELYCTIILEKAKAENYTVENLVFVKDGQLIDPRYITRVNETTIRLYMENMPESKQMYYCYLMKNQGGNAASVRNSTPLSSLEVSTTTVSNNFRDRQLVCMNMVAVGQEPREVENVTCISYNWNRMNCSWVVPKNYVKTNYTIKYFPKSRYHEPRKCPTDDDVNFGYCEWTLISKPQYRKLFETFKVNITGTNKFKSIEQTFTISHFAHILFDGPTDLKLKSKNTTSMTLQWNIGDIQYFPKPLVYKILYKYHNESNWETFICADKNVKQEFNLVWCTVGGLIPNKLYDFRVFMKSSLASDKYWSTNFASQVFRTNSSAPARSPRTDIGSFQIEHGSVNSAIRTVYIYWQMLKEVEHCGENFHYDITTYVVNDNGEEHTATDVTLIGSIEDAFAKYEIGPSRYRFQIRSANKEGQAPNASSIVVPATSEEVEPCSSFSKTDYGRSVYEVSWQPPASKPNIENYTIFWCKTEKERPYQCNGYTEWDHFPANVTKHNFSINTSESYQFAISANTKHSSSGMLWATCTVLHGHLGTVRQVYGNVVGPTSIVVSWKLECWDQASTIHGFLVVYCSTSGYNDTNCNEKERSDRWFGDAHLTKGNITGLKPYTYYRVTIRMFIDHQEGPSSTPVIIRTLEGPPDVDGLMPRLITRTNESVTIGWEVPHRMNGLLDHYTVLWHQKQEQKHSSMPVTTTQATITRLDPYTEYNVTVVACTSVCSKPMTGIVVRTRIGRPGVPNTPTIEPRSDLRGNAGSEVQWNPPTQLAGPHPYYEVYLLKDNHPVTINRTNDTRIWLMLPDCNSDHVPELHAVKVRAINVDDEADADNAIALPVVYEGEWSPVYAQKCNSGGIGIVWKMILWTTVPILLALLIGYGGRKGFYKCRQMKNVQVIIPMKFVLSPTAMPGDTRGHDLFENSYTAVSPLRPVDEFATLVERTAEQPA